MEFEKQVVPYMRRILRNTQNQELTQDIKLPEGMPDVGTVIGCWGQCVIRTKDWRTESIGVSGGVIAQVVYIPEGGGIPQRMEAWMPFQMKWNIPKTNHDGIICTIPLLYNADARSLSARKLMLRINLGIQAEAWCADETEFYAPVSIPEDIEILKETFPFRILKEAGEKAFDMEETLDLSTAEPKPESVIRCSLQPLISESKLMGDKVVFRGTASIHILYLSDDGQLYGRDFDVPFSQYGDLEGEYGQETDAQVFPAVTNIEVELLPEGSFMMKASLVGQYRIIQQICIELTKDAYSNLRMVQPAFQPLQLPVLLESEQVLVRAISDIGVDLQRCVDAAFMMQPLQINQDGEVVEGELCGTFRIVYYDPDGQLESFTMPWSDNWSISKDSEASVETVLQHGGKPSMNVTDRSVQADVCIHYAINSGSQIETVCGLETGQIGEPDPMRPSLILRRMDKLTLWELAKSSGSTVDLIQKANGLDEVFDDNRILLIPIP